MVRATQIGLTPDHEEEQICPLCINELDETERAWLPCSCGYQLCLFCYDRLKTEFSNRCPNCRVEYDSDFQAGLRRRQERVAQLQRETMAQREATVKAAGRAIEERSSGKHVQPPPPPPPPRAQRLPRSPRQDLRIEQEQLWPSLGAAVQVQPAVQHSHRQVQLHPYTLPTQRQPEGGMPHLGSPTQLANILPQPAPGTAEQEASSSSSADTAATTPQSPVCSVVCFRAVLPTSTCHSTNKPSAVPMAVSAPVQGRCAVVLQCGGVLGMDCDLEGANLAVSLQEAVRAGSLSVKQAAASLASYLRQRQLQQAASLGSSASSSPARGSHQPSTASSMGPGGASITPFSLPAGGLAAYANGSLLCGEGSLLPHDSGLSSAATSASLSHWAPAGSATLPLPGAPPALFGGMVGPTWQLQQAAPLVGSPVRDNDRLPLFMRRGALPAGAAATQSVCSPSSVGGSSGSSTASFPGFPSGSSSPTQELKRTLVPPPGFGPTPLGSTGIATLPRFR